MTAHGTPRDASGDEKFHAPPGVPIEPVIYGSTRELFEGLRCFIGRHPGLDANSVESLVFFLFAILFPECWGIGPFVAVVGADFASSTLLLRMLEWILPESVHLGEITLAGILSLPEAPGQVLLIDEPVPTRELWRVLRLMSRPGARLPWRAKLVEIFHPVIFVTQEPVREPWLQDLAIQIALVPTRSGLPKFDSPSAEAASQRIRAMLRQYRAENLAKVRASRFDAPELTSPLREIAALLGTAIVDDPELQARVIPLFRAQDEDTRLRRTDSVRAVVVEAGLFLIHEPDRTEARVGEFTTIANGIFKGRGETIELQARTVGDTLRSLGFFSERLGAAGRGIRLTREVRIKIHELAWALNVRSLQDRVDRCDFCKEARQRFDDPA